MSLASVLFSLLIGSLGYWTAGNLGFSTSTAAVMALVPGFATYLRWQANGKSSLILPICIFLLCFGAIVAAQAYAFQYSSLPFDYMVFVLYPSVVMCGALSLSGVLVLLKKRQAAAQGGRLVSEQA